MAINPQSVTSQNPIKVFLDGNAWCALFGEDVQAGETELGSTPAEALQRLSDRILEPSALEQWIKKPIGENRQLMDEPE